jgi:hypothetical protein
MRNPLVLLDRLAALSLRSRFGSRVLSRSLEKFIPNSTYQNPHLNLWVNPGAHLNAKPTPDEVTVTNFHYEPATKS